MEPIPIATADVRGPTGRAGPPPGALGAGGAVEQRPAARRGEALQHCVATYARPCLWGLLRFWSLRRIGASSSFRSVATIEVDPRARAIVQARGLRNGPISARLARILVGQWARRENLALRV